MSLNARLGHNTCDSERAEFHMRDRVRPDAERRYFLPSNGGFGRAYCPDQPTPPVN